MHHCDLRRHIREDHRLNRLAYLGREGHHLVIRGKAKGRQSTAGTEHRLTSLKQRCDVRLNKTRTYTHLVILDKTISTCAGLIGRLPETSDLMQIEQLLEKDK